MFKEGQKFKIVDARGVGIPSNNEGKIVTIKRFEKDVFGDEVAVTEEGYEINEYDLTAGYIARVEGHDAPDRYTSAAGDLWETLGGFFSEQAMIDHHRMNAIEYIIRCYDKGGVDDLEKAVVNLNRAIEKMKND